MNGGPPLVSGYWGAPWRRTAARLEGSWPLLVGGRAAVSGVQPPGSLSGYSVSVVCLFRMICSTALAVYPQVMSWCR